MRGKVSSLNRPVAPTDSSNHCLSWALPSSGWLWSPSDTDTHANTSCLTTPSCQPLANPRGAFPASRHLSDLAIGSSWPSGHMHAVLEARLAAPSTGSPATERTLHEFL